MLQLLGAVSYFWQALAQLEKINNLWHRLITMQTCRPADEK